RASSPGPPQRRQDTNCSRKRPAAFTRASSHFDCVTVRITEREAIVASKVVLVVDEDDDVRAEIRACLANRQISCREAATARDALRAALEDPPDLILVDLVLPD